MSDALVKRLRVMAYRMPMANSEMCRDAADRIDELEAKLAEAVDLVKGAFNEGFGEGMADLMRQSGGKTWHESRSRKRLAELEGEKDE